MTAAAADASAWFAAHLQVRSLDNSGQHPKAVASALGTKAGDAGASFRPSLSRSRRGPRPATRPSSTPPPTRPRAPTPELEPGLILAALIMAAACAGGVSRRLARSTGERECR